MAKINKVHHVDEARHLAFGREYLNELAERSLGQWSDEERHSFQKWLSAYLASSWGDFYNPAVYRDAGIEDSYNARKMALSHPACREMRHRVSQKVIDYFLETKLLSESPTI